jgi:transposase-like protein
MSPKLTPDERRVIVLVALEHDASVTELARRYGVSRSRIYQLLDSAIIDPKGRLREAERECAFRRRVKDLVG